MNKERYNQIVDEAYESYYNHVTKLCYDDHGVGITRPHTEEEFINRIKTEKGFSERWGLKIEERELYLFEMIRLAKYENEEEIIKTRKENINQISERLLKDNIPTRAISLTYNNETIEVYE